MPRPDILPVNFTLSPAAKRGIEFVRKEYDARSPADPAAVLSVAWGYVMGSDPSSGNVVVSFYPRSMLTAVADGIQEVSGVKFIYFTTDEHHGRFEGKVLDFAEDRGFFLREP